MKYFWKTFFPYGDQSFSSKDKDKTLEGFHQSLKDMAQLMIPKMNKFEHRGLNKVLACGFICEDITPLPSLDRYILVGKPEDLNSWTIVKEDYPRTWEVLRKIRGGKR